jgi:hypothetical protein
MSENVKKAYAVVVYEQISDETKLKNYMDIAPKTFGKFGALQRPKSFTTARNM